MNGSELRVIREAHAWTTDQVAHAVYRATSSLTMMEQGTRPVPDDVAAWACQVPPLPAPIADGYSPDAAGLRAWMADNHITAWSGAPLLHVCRMTVYRWVDGTHPPSRVVAAWLERGAPADWWPPDPPPMGRESVPVIVAPPVRTVGECPGTERPGPDWIWLPRQGWAPPGGWCHEGRDYGRVLGCRQCCWRTECRELTRVAS